MATRYLINRYATQASRRILRVEDPGEGEYVTRENGSLALRLGDCFDTFEGAKDEWIARCWRALQTAEEKLEAAEEDYEQAAALTDDVVNTK